MSALLALRRCGRMASIATSAIVVGRRATSPQQRARHLQAAFAELLHSHGVRVRVLGEWPSQPAVLVANHTTYLDPIVVGAHAPLAPLAKAEVAEWPLVGAAATRLGAIFVDRGCAVRGAMALRRGALALAAGVSVLVFPEGTTSTGKVLPFRLGAFGLAVWSGVPVVPVALEYSSPELAWVGGATFLPHYLRNAARARSSVLVRVGQPLWPRPQAIRGSSAQGRRAMAEQLSLTARRALCAMVRPRTPEELDVSAIGDGLLASRLDPVLSPARARGSLG